MFEKAHSVMFFVSDVPAAAKWYGELLETDPFHVLPDIPVIRLGHTEIWFHLADSKVSSGKAGTVTYWRVADFSAAIRRAEERGGVVYRGPLEIEDGDAICQIADPFGNLFGLIGVGQRSA
ncbi:MAG: glyoxalase [Methylotenera sp.]|nr:glyoxalase [Oligoflexia bacterium]